MNRQEEARIMDEFAKTYTFFPVGTWMATEPPMPDFVLTDEANRRIGIELTELFHQGNAKMRSAVKNQITGQVIQQLEKLLPYPFTLNVFLGPNQHVGPAGMRSVVAEVVDICVREFAALPDNTWGELQHIDFDFGTADPDTANLIRAKGYRNLPLGIDRIRIHRYDGLAYSFNSRAEGGLVPELTLASIEPIVSQKEEKLARQPRLDENWLVIREGNYFTGTFNDILFALPINSAFTKVFLFRTALRQVIELK